MESRGFKCLEREKKELSLSLADVSFTDNFGQE